MDRIERERIHHNRWAREKASDVATPFDHFLALENRWIVPHLPPLAGRRVLDIGCGFGEASQYFARNGACVTAIDVSEDMVRHTVAAARHEGFEIKGIVVSAEDLDVGYQGYDVIYVANVLHHLECPDKLIKKIGMALRPDGIAFFMEPLRYNPVINVYRRMASNVRTKDERPVGFDILDRIEKVFGDVQFGTTWFLSLVIFLKYYFIDRIHPDDDRYWRRILREPESTRRWIQPLIDIDKYLCRHVPPVKYFCWNIVIAAKHPVSFIGH